MKNKMMKRLALLFTMTICASALVGCTESADNSEVVTEEGQDSASVDASEDIVDEQDSLSEDTGSEESSDAEAETSLVSAYYLEEVADKYPDYVNESANKKGEKSDCDIDILFNAKEDVTDFKIYAVEYIATDSDDGFDFEFTEEYSAAELKKDTPTVIPIDFSADLPHEAFSYKDKNGDVKKFFIGQSGDDGSLFISPIEK